jgi:enamine deaminase RidA (YjgF/YER057c/UK114 family)
MRIVNLALVAWLAAAAATAHADSYLDFLNPDGLFKPSTFTQVVIAKGERMVFISGQTARDANSKVVGVGNPKAQAEQAMKNLKIAIEAAGGTMDDIAKITTFVVGLRPNDREWIGELVKKSFARPPAHTLVGISDLATPELLVEIEAIAVLK